MSTRKLRVRVIRVVAIAFAVLCGVGVSSLLGQQARIAPMNAPAAASQGPTSVNTNAVSAPHASPLFQRDESSAIRRSASLSAASSSSSDTHTITLSTVALVLVVIIVVLLLVR